LILYYGRDQPAEFVEVNVHVRTNKKPAATAAGDLDSNLYQECRKSARRGLSAVMMVVSAGNGHFHLKNII